MTLTENTKLTRGVGLSVSDMGKSFPGGTIAIERLDLEIASGEFLSILGPSGCGKSTLLRIIAGLENPTRGTLATSTPPRTAYVFQDAHLLPWRNVLTNVALPLELAGIPRQQRIAEARRAIESVGLADAAARYPAALSGGMRMRVSLARAMVTRPNLLLMDEPFAALDEITRHRLDEMLRELWLKTGMTIIFVTHSIAEAVFLSNRALVLSRRPAKTVLDHKLNLPMERINAIRTETAFARESQTLFDVLERGAR